MLDISSTTLVQFDILPVEMEWLERDQEYFEEWSGRAEYDKVQVGLVMLEKGEGRGNVGDGSEMIRLFPIAESHDKYGWMEWKYWRAVTELVDGHTLAKWQELQRLIEENRRAVEDVP